jgi:cytochrome c oxidase assembly protein subunit 15
MVMTFLVVLAGSVVRMTGSGMGCPDWPKCFGLMIPPTQAEEVTWRAGASYEPGRMLIANDTLWVAQEAILAEDFSKERDAGHWTSYDKHSYAIFNPLHTWVEFINRLLGALTGIPALLLLTWAFWRGMKARHWKPFIWAMVHLLLLGLVAWLGKKVVDGNLIPFSITIHMVGAVAILVSLVGMMQSITQHTKDAAVAVLGRTKGWLWIATALALVQLVIGTQVREQIDLLHHAGVLRSDWLGALPNEWKFHRSGSWLVALTQLVWIYPLRSVSGPARITAMTIVGLIAAQMVTGLFFVVADMPKVLQPVHLLLAVGLVLTNAWALFHYRASK